MRFKPLCACRRLGSQISLLLALTCSTASAAGGASLPNYSIRTWRIEEGLPQNGVTAVLQSQDGYLWLGTLAGLVRFDGDQFTVFDTDKTPDLRNDRITGLYEDPKGTIWIGHETGDLTRMEAGVFTSIELPSAWAEDVVSRIARDRVGDIWVQSREGRLARISDGLVFPPDTNPISHEGLATMARDTRGRLWATRAGRLCEVENGELSVPPQEPASPNDFIQCICPSSEGGLWVIKGGRLRQFREGEWRDVPSGVASLATANGVVELRDGWIAVRTTDQGLWLTHPQAVPHNFSRTNGLPSNWLGYFYPDREGNLWVGSSSGGLSVLRPVAFEPMNPPDHWDGMPVLSVCRAHDDTLWASTEGAGLFHLQDGRWTQYGPSQGLGSRFVWSVLEDAQARLWVATWGAGLFLRQGNSFQPAPGLEEVRVPMTALLQGHDGEIWVGTKAGLLRYENGQASWFGANQGVALADVRALAQDAEGAIWFGMMGGGLGCWKEGHLNQFRKTDGLSSDFILCLYFDAQGALWIGTSGGGLNRFKSGRFSKIGAREGLPNSIISILQPDHLGNLWLGSAGGVFRVDSKQLNDCADGLVPKVVGTSYGTWDGLETSECSGGCQPSSCRTADGRLWFPTRKGLACLSPGALQTTLPPPPVVIEQVLADGVALVERAGQTGGTPPRPPGHLVPASLSPNHSPLVVHPGRLRLEFHFTALNLTAPEQVRFRYRLDGYDDVWVEAGRRRAASYGTLPPGRYVFRVAASNREGLWSVEPAAVTLKVLPYLWQTWWFHLSSYLTAAAALAATVSLASRRRHRRNLENLDRRQALERERARIAQDMHDDLGASLTRIGLLSQTAATGVADPLRTADYLGQIYASARDLTRAMDEIVWAVNPRHDTLDSLLNYLTRFGHEFLGTAHIRCRMAFPVQLPEWKVRSEIRHNVFLAFKEALHNAVKHSGAREVRISLELRPAGFDLHIHDDGMGFDLSRLPAPALTSDRLASGDGLANIRNRLGSIGGAATIASAPEQGTCVSFSVPCVEGPSG